MAFKNKSLLLGSTAAMVALSPLVAERLKAASITMPARAGINSFVGLLKNTDLNFGSLTQMNAGTVRIDFLDNVSNIGGELNPIGGTVSSGAIKVQTQVGLQIFVSATAPTVKITTEGGGAATKTMIVSNIQFNIDGTAGTAISPVPTVPTYLLDVGANLRSSTNQALGTYAGSIKVQVTQP